MDAMMVLDTDVCIDHFRGQEAATSSIRSLVVDQRATTDLTVMAGRICVGQGGSASISIVGASLPLKRRHTMAVELEHLYEQIQTLSWRERLELISRMCTDLKADMELQEELSQWDRLSDEALDQFEQRL